MKKYLFACILGLLLTSCNNVTYRNKIIIKLKESTSFKIEESSNKCVTKGDNVTFLLDLDDDYVIESLSYNGQYVFDMLSETRMEITLFNVIKPETIEINGTKTDNIARIKYHYKDEERTIKYNLNHHKRINTSIGTNLFSYEGYTLKNWITKDNIEVGLGSRVSIKKGEIIDLYSSYLPWGNSNDYEYKIENNEATITKYKGHDLVCVIPEYIDSYPVKRIESNAFNSCPIEELILPKSINEIEKSAFINVTFSSLYMFDNIKEIKDDAFVDCNNFTTLHINAIQAPKYISRSKYSNYCDKIDLLIENQNKKKLVVFSGSSASFNIKCEKLNKTLKDYYCLNLGLNGFFSGIAQFEIFRPYLKENDILLHAPEFSSDKQLMVNNEMDLFTWECIEPNYDLLTSVNIKNLTKVFSTFRTFNIVRDQTSTYDSYSNYVSYINENGDWNIVLNGTTSVLGDDVVLNNYLLSDIGFSRRNEYYKDLYLNGIQVFLTYASFNIDALNEEQKAYLPTYTSILEEKIDSRYAKYISNYENYAYSKDSFYASNFHLNYSNSLINTQKVLDDLLKVMEE